MSEHGPSLNNCLAIDDKLWRSVSWQLPVWAVEFEVDEFLPFETQTARIDERRIGPDKSGLLNAKRAAGGGAGELCDSVSCIAWTATAAEVGSCSVP